MSNRAVGFARIEFFLVGYRRFTCSDSFLDEGLPE